MGAGSTLLLIASVPLLFSTRHLQLPAGTSGWDPEAVTNVIESLGVCALGILICLNQPSNRVGWLFLAAGFGLSTQAFGNAFAIFAIIGHHAPKLAGLAIDAVTGVLWPLPISMLILLILLFPTGEVPSPRWRKLQVATVAFGLFMFLVSIGLETQSWRYPFQSLQPSSLSGLAHALTLILFPAFLVVFPVLIISSLVSAVLRFRRSRGDERQQMKWFTFAAVFVVVSFLFGIFSSNGAGVANFAQDVFLMCLWVAIGIAMLKYRLYDIDLVIRKTVVGGVLVVFITVVYAFVVAGLGALGSSVLNEGPLIAAATALIALAFQPVLRRARHLANRLVYGERATPYEVLSEFSERMGEAFATEDLPERMARILADGTGAKVATVWLNIGGQLRPAATWPSDAPAPAPVRAPRDGDEPATEAPGRAFPVRHHGELLGALTVTMPPEEPMTNQQEKLCTDLAAQAGLVLRNVRLIEELRASRQRLVTAQDEERRKLERNLHDGAQQQLVALSVKETLASNMIDRDPHTAKALLAEIRSETSDALENLRDLARGIYPPLLADGGLAPALQAQARKAPLPVEVDADGVDRFPQEIEAAVYFSCLEALQNVSKYARASAARVILRAEPGAVAFTVSDDGTGFDTSRTNLGTGLQGISDRLAALGGSLAIDSAPGSGTRLRGTIPTAPG
jgi:signal transduction histidine kinase